MERVDVVWIEKRLKMIPEKSLNTKLKSCVR